MSVCTPPQPTTEPVIFDRGKALSYRYSLKRCFDVAFSVLVMPIVVPVALLITALIMIDSRGRVLIKVRRLGQHGTSFLKYKFRTMVPHAEKVLQQLLDSSDEIRSEYLCTYKIKNDPRVTRFGRFLRRTSLDELPQILNVLRGEMSWVGPRDILETEIVKYGDHGSKLISVRPGITGLWQVSGRSRLSYEQRVQLDMRYIDNLSFWMDLGVLTKTVSVVLLGDGAV